MLTYCQLTGFYNRIKCLYNPTPVKLLNRLKILTTNSDMLYGHCLLFLIQLLIHAVLQRQLQQKITNVINPTF